MSADRDPWADVLDEGAHADAWAGVIDFEAEEPPPVVNRADLGPYRGAEPPSFMREADFAPPPLPPGGGVMAPPTFNESNMADVFGPLDTPPPPRVSAPMSPEQEADIESKMGALSGPPDGMRDFSNALLTDRGRYPRVTPNSMLPTVEVGATRQKAPVDYRPYADLGDTVSAIPATVAGRYGMKWVGAQEIVASQDARKKYWQAFTLPEAIRRVDEQNRNTLDERERINYAEDPTIIEAAKRAHVRPDIFVQDWPSIVNMPPEELEHFKEENRALISEQDARLEGLARERQDIAAELQRIRPHFKSEWSGNALLFDSMNSVLADMLPTLAVGALAGPEAGLLTMGGLVLPESYAQNRNEGYDDATSLFGGLAQMAAELLPEGGVLEVALKTATGKEAMRNLIGRWAEGKTGHIISTAAAEKISEGVTEAINIGLDKGLFGKDVTIAEALNRMARAPVIGGLMGASMGVMTSPLPEPHIDDSAFEYGTPDALPESMPPPPPGGGPGAGYTPQTVADFADILGGQGDGGFAAPQLPPQQAGLPIPDRPKMPFISELPNVSVPAIRMGDTPETGTMPPPATTGSPAPGVGGSVGPTAPSTASQGTAPERRAGAYTIEVMVQDEASKGGAAIVEATPGSHGGWTLIQPDGNVIQVPVEDNRPLEEIVAEYTSASKDPTRVTIRKDQRPLATAFQQSAPPAPPASTEPAPTSAPQAGQPVSPTQKAGGVAPPTQGKLFGSEGEVVTPAPTPVWSFKDPNVSGHKFGAQIGDFQEGTIRVLLIDPDGSYFWGDRSDGRNTAENKPATWGEHAGYERAMFKTAGEAKAAGAAVPQTKRAPSGPPPPPKSQPPDEPGPPAPPSPPSPPAGGQAAAPAQVAPTEPTQTRKDYPPPITDTSPEPRGGWPPEGSWITKMSDATLTPAELTRELDAQADRHAALPGVTEKQKSKMRLALSLVPKLYAQWTALAKQAGEKVIDDVRFPWRYHLQEFVTETNPKDMAQAAAYISSALGKDIQHFEHNISEAKRTAKNKPKKTPNELWSIYPAGDPLGLWALVEPGGISYHASKAAAEKAREKRKPAQAEQETEPPKETKIGLAETGKRFFRRMFRGSGRSSKETAYNEMSAGEPILGDGSYWAFTEEGAKEYGPNVEGAGVVLENPLVIKSDDQWRDLTRKAGWEFPNPTGLPKEKQKAGIAKLRAIVEADGHDGIVVDFDDNEPSDAYRNNWIKTLRDVFGMAQAVVFKKPAQEKPAAPAAKNKPKTKKKQPPPQLDLPPPPPRDSARDEARTGDKLDAEVQREQAKAKKLYEKYMALTADLRAEDKMYRLSKIDRVIEQARADLAKAKTFRDYADALYDLTRRLLQAVENAQELETRRTERAAGKVNPLELPPPPPTRMGKPARKIAAQVEQDTEAVKELYAEYERLRPQFEEDRPDGAEIVEDQINDSIMMMEHTTSFRDYAKDLAELRERLEKAVKAATPKTARAVDPNRKFEPGQGFADAAPDVVEHYTTEEEFKEAVAASEELFADPDVRVRATEHPEHTGNLTPEQAAKRIEKWKAHAAAQGENADDNGNSERTIISLFDNTGKWSKPYVDAGYTVYPLDLQTGDDIRDFMDDPFAWLMEKVPFLGTGVHGMLIAVPCTDFASSGARWFAEKDADGRTEASKDLVIAALNMVELMEPKFWALENPVGRIESMTGLPKARYSFNPNDFGDPYTKKTMLWGKFETDLPVAPVEPTEGSKMHSKYGGSSLATKNARSETPEGFAYAFFMANNAIDNEEKLTGQDEDVGERAAGRDQQTLEGDPGIDANAPVPTLDEQADAVDAAADAAEADGHTDEAESLRRYAEELRKGKAPVEEEDSEEATLKRLETHPGDALWQQKINEYLRQALEKEEAGDTEGARQLREYAHVMQHGEESPYANKVAEAEDTPDELRRAQRTKSKKQPGPFSMTREGPVRAAPDTIWTDNNVNPDLIENATPQRRFAKAAELLKKRFGFRDIQMDKNLPIGEAIDALKDAWIGLTNLASVHNVNAEFMSLNGRLALQLHREAEGALAYYRPGTKTIGMTRRNDSFAHEWAHALDHWLIETFAQDIMQYDGRHLTGKTRIGGTTQTLDHQVRDAVIELLNAMYFDATKAAAYVNDLELKIASAKTASQKAALQKKLDTFKAGHSKKQDIISEYYAAAKRHDARSMEGDTEKSYWQRPTEMFARVFEAFTANKLDGYPADHPFVTQSKRMYDEGRTGDMKVPYPKDADRANIFDKLDTLMKAMRDRGLAPTGNAPAMLNPMDPHYWRKMAPQLPAQAMRQVGSIWRRLKAPFDAQKAESHRADHEARARDAQDQKIRDVQLNVGGYGSTRRWLSNQGLKLLDYIKALPSMLAFTIRGNLLSMRDLYKGNAGVLWLQKHFAHDPGANLGTQQKTYSEEIRHWEKHFQNIFGALVKKHNVRSFDNTELRQLRDVLVNAIEADTVDPKIAAAAADFRRFLNDMYNYNVSNGVNLGYAKNGYLPRIVDRMFVEEHLPEFKTQSLKLYKLVYPREVGTLDHVLEDPLKHPDRLKNLTQYVREIAKNGQVLEAKAAAEALKDDAKALDKALEDLKEAAEAGEDTDQLEEQIRQLGEKIYDGLREPWALEAANDWEQRIRGGKTPEFAFDQRNPSTNYMKTRVLPEETDTIMGDFLKNDPLELITTYVSQSVHRVEFGKFFGNPAAANARQGTPERKLGWKLDEALAAAQAPYTAADGSEQRVNSDHFEELQKSINLLVGRHETMMTRKAIRWRTTATAILTPFVLARSLWSQFSEPIALARATGNYFDILRVFHAQLQDLLGPIIAKVGLKGPKAQAAWRREMSEYFGVVADHMADSLMLQRYNLMEMNSSDRVHMQRFFKVTGIHPHAMSMRRATTQVFMQRYAPKIAKRALGKGSMAVLARQALAELGLDSSNKELLRELASLPNIRTAQELEKLRYLDHIRTAVNRFVDSAVMDPKAVDKPRMASMPEYTFMYGILSFQYAFQRHVLIATGKRIANAWAENKAIGIAQGLSAIANVQLMMAAQMAAYMMRSIIYGAFKGDDDDWKNMKERLQEKQTLPFTGITAPNWAWQSMSRSGMFGAFDPMINAFMGLKYERDLTQLMAGPLLAVPLKFVQDASRASNSDKPITADGAYKLTEIGWKTASMFVTAKLLSYAGAASPLGGLYDAALGVGLPFLTSDRVVKWAGATGAELISGQKYVSPAVKAGAAAGNPADMAEKATADAQNSALGAPVASKDDHIQE